MEQVSDRGFAESTLPRKPKGLGPSEQGPRNGQGRDKKSGHGLRGQDSSSQGDELVSTWWTERVEAAAASRSRRDQTTRSDTLDFNHGRTAWLEQPELTAVHIGMRDPMGAAK